MDPRKKNAAPGPGRQSQHQRTHEVVGQFAAPSLAHSAVSPLAAEALPASERAAYRQGFQAGCVVSLGAHDAIWRDGHVAGHEAGFAAGWEAGRADLLSEQDAATQAAARAAAKPWLTGPTYWDLAALRGEPERARRAYQRAQQTGLVA